MQAPIVNYMNSGKRSYLVKAFVTSQSNFCSLMFRSRIPNCRIDKVVSFQNLKLSYLELLELESSVTLHHWNKQEIITDYFLKSRRNLAPKTIREMFDFHESNYNFGSEISYFKRADFKSTHHGI